MAANTMNHPAPVKVPTLSAMLKNFPFVQLMATLLVNINPLGIEPEVVALTNTRQIQAILKGSVGTIFPNEPFNIGVYLFTPLQP